MIRRIMIDPSLERKLNKPDYDIRYNFNLTIKIPEKYASLTCQMTSCSTTKYVLCKSLHKNQYFTNIFRIPLETMVDPYVKYLCISMGPIICSLTNGFHLRIVLAPISPLRSQYAQIFRLKGLISCASWEDTLLPTYDAFLIHLAIKQQDSRRIDTRRSTSSTCIYSCGQKFLSILFKIIPWT